MMPSRGRLVLPGRRSCSQASVRIGTFCVVLEHLAGASVHPDLEGPALALDVKRIAKPRASALLLEFLVRNPAGTYRKGGPSSLRKRDLRHPQEVRAVEVGTHGGCRRSGRAEGSCGREG